MTDLDLSSYVARTRALVETRSPTTRAETTAWLVGPFLECLGWTVHDDGCTADATVEGATLEYVCSAADVPALFVATESAADSLDRSRAETVLGAMAETGVDRAIYTNGEEFVFFADPAGDDRLACHRSELPDHEPAIAAFSRSALRKRLERHSRDHVARRLAVDRPALADSMTDRLATVTGDAYAEELSTAVDRFLESLVRSFAADEATPVPDSDARAGGSDDPRSLTYADPEAGTKPESEPVRAADATSSSGSADGPHDGGPDGEKATDATEAASDDATNDAVDDADDSGDAHDDHDDNGGDGEYVVRFFGDRGSVGAIGHSSPTGALVGAAEFLLERGLSGVSLPWPDAEDDPAGPTVLNDAPRRGDGSPMTDPTRLSTGWHLETAGDADACAARIETLAARAGLRPMLTGDWDGERDSD